MESEVTLSRTRGPTQASCFDQSSLWFPVSPLVETEEVRAKQEYIKCKLESDDLNSVTVGPATPVPIPVVDPLCAQSTKIHVSNLLVGCKVRILQDDNELGIGEAPNSDCIFEVSPLPSGVVISAQQELCDIWSDKSNKVIVDPSPSSIPVPEVNGPLFECGSVVLVRNVHAGSKVYVYSSLLGTQPIGDAFVYPDVSEVYVHVAPLLILDDEIYAVQKGCGITSTQLSKTRVEELGNVNPPKVKSPIDECMRTVPVIEAIPGATIDLYVNNEWRGQTDAGKDSVDIPITHGRLNVGDFVRVSQRICKIITDQSEPVKVQRSPGTWKTLNVSAEILVSTLLYYILERFCILEEMKMIQGNTQIKIIHKRREYLIVIVFI